MIALKIQLKNILAPILIIAILAPSCAFLWTPKKAEAQWAVVDIKVVALEVVKSIARKFARNLLNRMTQSTINWINSGFDGKPLFLQNPDSFFKDIAKTEIKYMVDLFGYDRLKYPFGKDFAQNIIRSYQSQFATNAQYSLSNVINDQALLEAYRNDFSVGGWSGFLLNTQYPQNNYIGFNMMAMEELSRRLDGTVQNAAQKAQTALSQGQGFLSPQVCRSNPNYNTYKNQFQRPTFHSKLDFSANAPKREDYADADAWGRAMLSYEADFQARQGFERAAWEQNNTCADLVTTTPGSVVSSHIMRAINSKYEQSELAAALGNSLSAIFDALLNHFIDKGLSSLFNRDADQDNSEDDFGRDNPEGLGQCVAYINSSADQSLKGEVLAAQERAWAANPTLASSPANIRANHEAYRDLVIAELNSAGLEASMTHNGNCNISPNNIGVRSPGSSTGEIYDVVREEEDGSITIQAASRNVGRPAFQGTASWNFITNGGGTLEPADNSNPSPFGER